MSEPRIYTGAEALALLAAYDDAPPSLLPWGLETDGDDWIIVAPESASEIARLPRLEGAETDARHIVDAVNDRRNLAASVAHHEARSTGLESLLLTFADDALGAIGRNPLPAGTHPVEAARYAAAQVRLFADDVTTARDSHFARAQRAEAERDRWRNALRRCAARCEGSVATGPDDVDGLTSEVLDELGIVDEAYGSAQRVAEAACGALGLGDGMPRVEDDEDAVCEAIEARGAALIADRDAALRHADELEAALREARAGLDNAVTTVVRPREELATERTARARAEAAMDERGLRLVAMVRERDALRAAVREYVEAAKAWDAWPNGSETASAVHRRKERASDALRALVTEAPDVPRAPTPDAYAVSAEPSPAVRRAVEALGGTILTAEVRVWWHRGPDGEVRPMPVVTEAPDAR